MKLPILHLVVRHLAPELAAFVGELRRRALVYCFESTDELLAGWRLARRGGVADLFSPTAVVWLQSRSAEFAQREIDEAQTLDPLARSIVVAGCWSEGEPRSGRPLVGATRVYWHQGWSALWSLIVPDERECTLVADWIAIHTSQLVDYLGLASVCQSLGLRTIWQSERGPAISSEPAARLFAGWNSWEAWQEQCHKTNTAAPALLLLNFPRPEDQIRAQREQIIRVLAQPFSSAELRHALTAAQATPRSLPLPRNAHARHIQHNPIAPARRRSA